MNTNKFKADFIYQTIGLIPFNYITKAVYVQVFDREGDKVKFRHYGQGKWTNLRKALVIKDGEYEFLDYKVNGIKYRCNTKVLKKVV